MDSNIIKSSVILSLILGAVLGVVAIIPIIGLISFLVTFVVSSAIVMIYMKKRHMIGVLTPKDSAILGGIIGFTSSIGFLITMVPLAGVIALLNHLYFHKLLWYSSIGIWFTYGIAGIITLFFLIFFVAVISALMNSCSGLGTIYIYRELLNEEDTNQTFFIDN